MTIADLTEMMRKMVAIVVVMLLGLGSGMSAKAMTERTAAPWYLDLENKAVKTTPTPEGGTCSENKGKGLDLKLTGRQS